jgi:hypothetical protein
MFSVGNFETTMPKTLPHKRQRTSAKEFAHQAMFFFQNDKESMPPPVATEETPAADDSVVIVEDEGVEPNVSNKNAESTEPDVDVEAKEPETPAEAKEAPAVTKEAPVVAKETSTFIASAAAGKISSLDIVIVIKVFRLICYRQRLTDNFY